MTLSVSNIRDMLADGQEDLVRTYISMFSCVVEQDDGSVKELNPDMQIMPVSALNGDGFDAWISWLREEIKNWRENR